MYKKYLTVWVGKNGVILVMGDAKDLRYATEVVNRHNECRPLLGMKHLGKWKVFELGKEVKINGTSNRRHNSSRLK